MYLPNTSRVLRSLDEIGVPVKPIYVALGKELRIIQDNGIKCLETGFVQVSANIRAVCNDSSNNGLILGGIFLKPTGKVNTYLMGGLSGGVLQSGFVCLSIPVFTIKVNKGDVLQLKAKKLDMQMSP